MGFLKNLRQKTSRRRNEAAPAPAAVAPGAVITSPGELPPAPRNRAERRFWSHRLPKMARRIEMRATTKRQGNRRIPRWQRHLMRELSGHYWGDKRGRVMPRG